MPEGDDLAISLFFLSLAIPAFGLEAMKAETIPRRITLAILAIACLLAALFWLQLKLIWPPFAATMASISTNPVAWFCLVMFILGVLAFHQPRNRKTPNAPIQDTLPLSAIDRSISENREPAPIKNGLDQWTTFITNVNIAAGLTPQTLTPVLLIGTAALNEKRLRIVVAHSHYTTGIGWHDWTEPRQIELADLRDVISGQSINIPVVSCKLPADNSTNLMWGAVDGPPVNAVRKSTKYRAQIRIIGAEGTEQLPINFLLIRTTVDEPPYLVNVTKETEFSFANEWRK
jgi:hypothetical protein